MGGFFSYALYFTFWCCMMRNINYRTHHHYLLRPLRSYLPSTSLLKIVSSKSSPSSISDYRGSFSRLQLLAENISSRATRGRELDRVCSIFLFFASRKSLLNTTAWGCSSRRLLVQEETRNLLSAERAGSAGNIQGIYEYNRPCINPQTSRVRIAVVEYTEHLVPLSFPRFNQKEV